MNNLVPFEYQVLNEKILLLQKELFVAVQQIGAVLSPMQPTIQSMFSSYQDRFEKLMDEERRLCLTGRGPRATTLRQLAEFFPEKNFEDVISAGIPKELEIDYTDVKQWYDYTQKMLGDFKSYSTGVELAWLATVIPTQLKDAYIRDASFRDIDLENAPSGFYRDTQTSYTKHRWFFVLNFGKVIYVRNEDHYYFQVWVDVEQTWVRSKRYAYVPMALFHAEFHKILIKGDLFDNQKLTLSTVIDVLEDQLTNEEIPSLSAEDYKRLRDPLIKGEKFKFTFGYTHEPIGENDSIGHNLRMAVKTEFGVLELWRRNHTSEVDNSFKFYGNIPTQDFEALPYRARRFILDCFSFGIDEISKKILNDNLSKQLENK